VGTQVSIEPPSSTQISIPRHWNATQTQWNDWRWQLAHRITTPEQLEKIFNLSDAEKFALENTSCSLPVSITPYYVSLMDPDNPTDPLRKCMVPTIYETVKSRGEEEDPLHEAGQSPTPTLVHRYPDRVLFLTTNLCSNFCRFCTRSRLVGKHEGNGLNNRAAWKKNLDYIKAHTEVRDVLLSGGDPLILPDRDIEWLVTNLRAIPHVEFIRIGTKMPIVLPQRITEALAGILKKGRVWMSIHCTHPKELTAEVSRALDILADNGIPLGSQTVLLAGINDNIETMRALMHGLLRNRVRPYYLYSCDRITGSAHFAVPVQRGLGIIRALRGHTSGYAVPTFVIDAPGGGGKIPVIQDNIVYQDDNTISLRNYEGKIFNYPLI